MSAKTQTRLQTSVPVSLLAYLAGVVVVSCWAVFALHWPKTGWDFPVFYIAAALPSHEVYSRAAFELYFQQHLQPLGIPHWARFVRPPAFLYLLRPLATLGYLHALWIWMAAGLAAYLVSILVLIRHFRFSPLMVPLFLAFYPAVAGLVSGQDNCLFLLLVITAWKLTDANRAWLAGFTLTASLWKFNLVILLPLLLLVHKRYRTLGSFAAGAILVTALSCAVTPFSTYLSTLITVPKETPDFIPAGLRGLTLIVGQAWCYPLLAVLVLGLCWWLLIRLPLTESFCVAITGGLLVVPYVTWYDSTLLVLPAALIYARGSYPTRLACIFLLLALPLWPILPVHALVELLVLAYFARGVASWKNPAAAFDARSARTDPVQQRAGHCSTRLSRSCLVWR